MDTIPKRSPQTAPLIDQPADMSVTQPIPVIPMPGDRAWMPTPAVGQHELLTRADLFQILASAVAGGAAVPIKVEFFENDHRRELEIQTPDGDRATTTMLATLFGLPLPTQSTATVRRGAWEYAAFFGSSSARRGPGTERDDDVATGPEFGGWRISVCAYVDATLGGGRC